MSEVIDVIDKHLSDMIKVVNTTIESALETERGIMKFINSKVDVVRHDRVAAPEEYKKRADSWVRDCNQAIDVAAAIKKKGRSINNVVGVCNRVLEEEKKVLRETHEKVVALERQVRMYEKTEERMNEMWGKKERLCVVPSVKHSSFKLVRKATGYYELSFVLRNVLGKEMNMKMKESGKGIEWVLKLLSFGDAKTEVVDGVLRVLSTGPVKVQMTEYARSLL
eukprot:gnl/Chilomastix_caulleri/740.p1 GENE.gnl/Chilomastix_caulleri/740~~gnl/Chilomastix_caulleri/740.p1  ORF type:complete len:223 (+),score=107.06 gnl/Chilomastix_caulleri/740:181-849(+)